MWRRFVGNTGGLIDYAEGSQQLKRIGSTIASLNSCCEEMRRHVQSAHRETGPVLEEATTLFSQKYEVETKQALLDAFKQHFLMSPEEEETLTSMSATIDDRFFTYLTRLKNIHQDCQILLGSENQQLGLELMQKSSRDLNVAFQKLSRWIQKEFKNLNLENPQISSSIRRSLRVLAEQPTLFQNCLDFFAEARERNLSESFYRALTGSSQSHATESSTKPIEYYAHDSLRFVGDMLAWTHSAAVSEREALELLFISEGDEMAKGIQVGRESEPWSQETSEAFDGRKALEQLVNRDLAGVARVLRQRIEQVIQSDEDAVLSFKIGSLIDFYRVTFARLLGTESAILDTLSSLRESSLRQYRFTMQDRVNSIQMETNNPTTDLAIPRFLDEAFVHLKELMKSYDSSLSQVTSRETEFSPILTEALDPFLESCKSMANGLEEPRASIFMINCLLAAKATISSYDFTTTRVSEMNWAVQEYVSKLVDYQQAYFLHTSGLHPLIVALAPLSDLEEDTRSIAKLEPFKVQALRDTSQVLDDFLPSALMDAIENLKLLKNSRMSEDITAEAAQRFCEDFEFIEGRLRAADELRSVEWNEAQEAGEDGEEAPVALRTLFPRTSGEIWVLLS